MNTAANTDGVHVELTVEGLGRETFAHAVGWVWEQADVLFPLITGQWSFTQAIVPAVVLAGLMQFFRLLVHLADGGSPTQIPRALISDPHNPRLVTWRSHKQWEGMQQDRVAGTVYGWTTGALAMQPPPAPVRERIDLLDGFSHLAHDLFFVLCKLYVHYMALSIAVCWIFGVGDLGVFAAVLGIGGV